MPYGDATTEELLAQQARRESGARTCPRRPPIAIDCARAAVLAVHADREGPYSGASEADLRAALPDPLPEHGTVRNPLYEARDRI